MAIPDPLPDEIRLTPSRWKWLAVTAICTVFAVIGGLMATGGDLIGWASLLFFGPGALMGTAMVIGWRSHLVLRRDGFEQAMLGRTLVCRWADVSGLAAWHGPGRNRLVTFTRTGDAGALASVNRALSGGTASLGDSFGMRAEDLAALMRAFQDRALAEADRPEP